MLGYGYVAQRVVEDVAGGADDWSVCLEGDLEGGLEEPLWLGLVEVDYDNALHCVFVALNAGSGLRRGRDTFDDLTNLLLELAELLNLLVID